MKLVRARWWRKPRGGVGWAAVAGLVTGIATWWPISVAAAGGWFALAMLGYRRSAVANAYLDRAFPDAKRSEHVSISNELSGEVDGRGFVIRNGLDTMHILVWTSLPTGLTIDRARDARSIGDPVFDAQFRVVADDSACELWWRVLLSAEIRARFCEVFAGYSAELRDGWFDVMIDDDEADGPAIERLIREACALVTVLWKRLDLEDPLSWFVEHIPADPEPGVRMTHYEWLVTGGYEVPAVLQLASKDPDPEIQRWANEQRPTETEYR